MARTQWEGLPLDALEVMRPPVCRCLLALCWLVAHKKPVSIPVLMDLLGENRDHVNHCLVRLRQRGAVAWQAGDFSTLRPLVEFVPEGGGQ